MALNKSILHLCTKTAFIIFQFTCLCFWSIEQLWIKHFFTFWVINQVWKEMPACNCCSMVLLGASCKIFIWWLAVTILLKSMPTSCRVKIIQLNTGYCPPKYCLGRWRSIAPALLISILLLHPVRFCQNPVLLLLQFTITASFVVRNEGSAFI